MTDDQERNALEALHELEEQIEGTRWTVADRTFTADGESERATLELEYDPTPEIATGFKQPIQKIIADIESDADEGAHIDTVVDEICHRLSLKPDEATYQIEQLRRNGDVYEPTTDHLRTV